MDAPAPHRFVARVIEEYENAIHRDDVARRYGFRGALVPGVELFARTTTPLVAAWGEDWLRGGRIDVRFRRPTYDGEELLVEVDTDDGVAAADGVDGGRLTVRGPDGERRCVGSVARTAPPPDLGGYPEVAASGERPADPAVGPMATVHRAGTVEEHAWYLDAVGEPLPLYRERSLASPGWLLRLVNQLLIAGVALGPWVHTASDCRFLGLARLPADLAVRGRVTGVGRRGGHDEVRYDALVLADDEPVLQVAHTALYRLAGA